MEARSHARLDAQDNHICQLTSQLKVQPRQERHYSLLQKGPNKFQGMVMQWMKQMKKQSGTTNNDRSPNASTVLPTTHTNTAKPHHSPST